MQQSILRLVDLDTLDVSLGVEFPFEEGRTNDVS